MKLSTQSPLYRYVSACVRYPFSWAGVLLVALAHHSFTWWFTPSLSMQALLWLVDTSCLLLLMILTLRSSTFANFYQQRNYQAARKTVAAVLADGMAEFRTAALACLALSQQLHTHFRDEPSLHEFEEFLHNIMTMAENHRTLYVRSQQFGTAEQKDKMRALLDRQLQSMQQTLENLQAFSGNLTILSARLEKSALAARELQFINQGLQEVLQEMVDV